MSVYSLDMQIGEQIERRTSCLKPKWLPPSIMPCACTSRVCLCVCLGVLVHAAHFHNCICCWKRSTYSHFQVWFINPNDSSQCTHSFISAVTFFQAKERPSPPSFLFYIFQTPARIAVVGLLDDKLFPKIIVLRKMLPFIPLSNCETDILYKVNNGFPEKNIKIEALDPFHIGLHKSLLSKRKVPKCKLKHSPWKLQGFWSLFMLEVSQKKNMSWFTWSQTQPIYNWLSHKKSQIYHSWISN